MEAFLIVTVVFLSVVTVVKIIADARTRGQLIQKGEVNENLATLFKAYGTYSAPTLNGAWYLSVSVWPC